VARVVGEGDAIVMGAVPLAPRAMKIIELARLEALSQGHRNVGTEHLLLGLGRELRREILALMSGRPGDA
jgi:hypothetical protein